MDIPIDLSILLDVLVHISRLAQVTWHQICGMGVNGENQAVQYLNAVGFVDGCYGANFYPTLGIWILTIYQESNSNLSGFSISACVLSTVSLNSVDFVNFLNFPRANLQLRF